MHDGSNNENVVLAADIEANSLALTVDVEDVDMSCDVVGAASVVVALIAGFAVVTSSVLTTSDVAESGEQISLYHEICVPSVLMLHSLPLLEHCNVNPETLE